MRHATVLILRDGETAVKMRAFGLEKLVKERLENLDLNNYSDRQMAINLECDFERLAKKIRRKLNAHR